MKNKELSDKIADILSNSPIYNGNVHMCEMGIKEENYPLIYECSDIELKVSEVRKRFVTISVYVKGCNEKGCTALHSEIPAKTLREVYKIVKKYFK